MDGCCGGLSSSVEQAGLLSKLSVEEAGLLRKPPCI